MCLGFHHCPECEDTSPCGKIDNLNENPLYHEPDICLCARHSLGE